MGGGGWGREHCRDVEHVSPCCHPACRRLTRGARAATTTPWPLSACTLPRAAAPLVTSRFRAWNDRSGVHFSHVSGSFLVASCSRLHRIPNAEFDSVSCYIAPHNHISVPYLRCILFLPSLRFLLRCSASHTTASAASATARSSRRTAASAPSPRLSHSLRPAPPPSTPLHRLNHLPCCVGSPCPSARCMWAAFRTDPA